MRILQKRPPTVTRGVTQREHVTENIRIHLGEIARNKRRVFVHCAIFLPGGGRIGIEAFAGTRRYPAAWNHPVIPQQMGIAVIVVVSVAANVHAA